MIEYTEFVRVQPPPLPTQSFEKDLAAIEQLAYTPVRRAQDLADNLQEIYRRAANARFTDYDVRAVAEAAPEVMYQLFDLRVALRARIEEFEKLGLMSPMVIQGLRDVFRVLRYVSDMLGEIALMHARTPASAAPRRAFSGGEHNTLINYAYCNGVELPFRAGDVILVRGHAHNSAAIARIGDVDSQFSHLGIVHIDDKNQAWMVESLIEDGAVVTPLAYALEHGMVRAVLYRHKDQALAGRAAQRIYDYVTHANEGRGQRILYDFTMRLDRNRNLFCSKLVRLAYDQASDGICELPTYPTRIAMKNRDFLDRIGVKTDRTFAPADIDLESGFNLVAEWQDYRETSNIRLQDFTMDKIFEWMEGYGYRFKETPVIRLVALLGRFSSHISKNARQLLFSALPRVPSNMSRKTVATVAMLHKTAEPLYHELQDLEQRSIRERGLPMHGLEILDALERIRQRNGDHIGYLTRPPAPEPVVATGEPVTA